MALNLRLDIRQSQGLVMTPQLQQAIKLLQLPNIELAAYVDQELETNPFLSRPEADESGERTETDHGDGDPSGDAGGVDDGWMQPVPAPAADNLIGTGRGGSLDFRDDLPDLEARLTTARTLHEHLNDQLCLDVARGAERMIGHYLIDQVDEAGYITGDLALIATQLGCPVAALENVLERLQRFDPTGVCARGVAECLALQLRELDRLDPAMQSLLANLDRLARGDLAGLRRICGVDAEDLADMIAELRSLDPKPGLAFAHGDPPTAIPDVHVIAAPGGGWRVELNDATLPRVLVDVDYYATVTGSECDRRGRDYLSERFQSANWLVRALDQRARTVLRVAEALVIRQTGFFRHGVQHLRPLALRDIAEAIGVHESTVSRATAGKYLATPRGTIAFRYFFTNAVGTGEVHAAEAIRQRIKTLIDNEDPRSVLSDDQIVTNLRGDGVELARRTVAKYREALGIASSVRRRRTKALGLV